MYQSRLIDLSNYKEKDLILTGIKGGILSISTKGSATVKVKGEHSATGKYDLALIDLKDFSKLSEITEEGMYVAAIVGCDKVNLEVSGSGEIYVKEM